MHGVPSPTTLRKAALSANKIKMLKGKSTVKTIEPRRKLWACQYVSIFIIGISEPINVNVFHSIVILAYALYGC